MALAVRLLVLLQPPVVNFLQLTKKNGSPPTEKKIQEMVSGGLCFVPMPKCVHRLDLRAQVAKDEKKKAAEREKKEKREALLGELKRKDMVQKLAAALGHAPSDEEIAAEKERLEEERAEANVSQKEVRAKAKVQITRVCMDELSIQLGRRTKKVKGGVPLRAARALASCV